MSSVLRARPSLAAAAVLTALAVGLMGCSGSDSGGDSNTSAEGAAGDAGAPVPPAAEPGGDNAGEKDAGGGSVAGAGAGADLRIDTRSIIYNGSLTVRVDDVEAKASQVVGMATAAGGFVGGDKRRDQGTYAEATLTLRVPAERFTAILDGIAELGEQQSRDVNTEDVTEEVVDLDARIATQQARVASGRRLLASAKTLNDLVMLEGEVAKREADLASLEAKKRRLDDLTALSTITATLLGPDAAAVIPEEESKLGFVAGLEGGWEAFVSSLRVALTVLGALLPWVIAIGGPVLLVLYLLRRQRRRPISPPPPDTPAV
jgi:Domain of unknown function (DUF4349)